MSITQRMGSSPRGSDTNRKNSDRLSSSPTQEQSQDGRTKEGLETAKEEGKDDDRYNNNEEEEETTTTTDADKSSSSNRGSLDGTFAPITSPPVGDEYGNRLQATRSIERSWSLNDGYSVHTGEDEAGEKIDEEAGATGAQEPPEFVVAWDDNDPMNPRNMSTPRRWFVVIICSLGSLCVYGLVYWFG